MMMISSFRLLLAASSCCLLAMSVVTTTTAFVVTPPVSISTRGLLITKSSHDHSSKSSSSSSTTTSLAATSAYKKIFVAGGSRGVGRQVVEQLVNKKGDEAVQVVCMVRDEAVAKELREMSDRVTAVIGDASDQKTVENCMDGCDAAITTLGGKVNPEESLNDRIDYIGNNNVIESAGILGVTRVILVTSVGCGSSQQACPPKVYETLKDRLEAKSKAENVLQRYYTNTNWTIIRPGGLKSEPMTGKAILTQDANAIGTIHRADLARLILEALDSAKAERKILTAIDPSIESSASAAATTTSQQFEVFAM